MKIVTCAFGMQAKNVALPLSKIRMSDILNDETSNLYTFPAYCEHKQFPFNLGLGYIVFFISE